MATFSPARAPATPWLRQGSGLLLVLILHGALLFCWRRPLPIQNHDGAYPLLALRLYPPARPAKPDTVGIAETARPAPRHTAAAISPPRVAAPGTSPPAPSPADAVPASAAPAPLEGAAASSPSLLDIDQLKAVARKNAGDGERQPSPAAPPVLSASQKTQRALEGAPRPKCDQNYRPMLGGVGFKELLALPLMLKEGASDSGCHW